MCRLQRPRQPASASAHVVAAGRRPRGAGAGAGAGPVARRAKKKQAMP